MSDTSWEASDPTGSTWSEILSIHPLIIHAWPSIGFPLGSASVIGPLVRDRAAHFLIMPSWTIEPPEYHQPLIEIARSYLADHPRHRLTFLGNTNRETQIMAQAGFDAITLNQNCLMDDAVFRPLPGVGPIYDAVYNARLTADKRPELAAETERLALIFFYDRFEFTVPQFHAEHARLKARLPRATFINQLTPQGCKWLFPNQVNAVLAQSRVGLCLSAVEGPMRAAIEYLFAGLSVVSTPSLGGRDYYFDEEYCLTVDPDPRAVRGAVEQLIARAVPRAYVRARTMTRIEADRTRYIAFVQSLIDASGGQEKFADRFWALTRSTNIQRWRSMAEFTKTVLESL